jgi:two-component system alkaline phosphatase synthesis response regulator PhoP
MSHKKILLIDDEDDIREIAAFSFESAGGFDVETAEGGRAGIEKALGSRPDVVLLDVMMPGLDGPSTLALLQSHDDTRDIPVIFLTAKVQASDKRNLLALGARGIIAKPFDPILLPDTVLEMLS